MRLNVLHRKGLLKRLAVLAGVAGLSCLISLPLSAQPSPNSTAPAGAAGGPPPGGPRAGGPGGPPPGGPRAGRHGRRHAGRPGRPRASRQSTGGYNSTAGVRGLW